MAVSTTPDASPGVLRRIATAIKPPRATTETSTTPEPALKIAPSEVKNVRIRSADNEANMVKISQPVFDTLLNTATFNIEIFNEIPEAQRPAILKDFAEALKHYKPSTPELQQELKNIDFKDKAKVKKLAEDFLKHGGGEALLSTFKVMEWEASLLHGASGAKFNQKKEPKSGTEAERPKVYFIDKNGARVEDRDFTATEKISNWFKGKNSKEVPGQYDLEISNSTVKIGVPGSLIAAGTSEAAYLEKCGWANGIPIENGQNRGILIDRLFNVLQARSEIFTQTGLNSQEVGKRINFIDAGGFITVGRGAHLIGEVTGGYTPAEFTTEAHTITEKIKTDAIEKLNELKKKNKSEQRGKQLTKRIEQLGEEKDMDPDQIEAEKAVIEQQIKDKKAEAKLFDKQKLIPGEKAITEKTRSEKDQALNDRAADIGVPRSDLEDWSADSSNAESWRSMQERINLLNIELQPINDKIARLKTDREHWSGREPKTPYSRVVAKDGSVKETNKDAWDKYEARIKDIEDKLDAAQKELSEKAWMGRETDGVKPAEKILTELTLEMTRRKQIVENPDTQKAITDYKTADKLHTQKIQEEVDNNNKVDGLRQTDPATGAYTETVAQAETRIRKEIKDLKEKQENVGKVDADDQREIESLEIVAELYNDPAKKDEMEQRLVYQDGGTPPDLEFSPEFKDYPKAVLQAVNLMFGPEALSSTAGNPELFKKAKSLLESKWFVQVIIDQIEIQNGLVNPAVGVNPNKVAFGAARISGDKNVEIDMAALKLLTTGKPIDTFGIDNVNRQTIENILEGISKSALGYI